MPATPLQPSSPATGISGQRLQCFKTKRCRFWLEGRCTRADRCTYAHTEVELRVPPDLTKTKICTRWKRGACESSAADCAYAHGAEDLRMPSSRLREELYEKTKVTTPMPLTGRSITSSASTVCSRSMLDSSALFGFAGLFAGKSGSSSIYSGDEEEDASEFLPDSNTPGRTSPRLILPPPSFSRGEEEQVSNFGTPRVFVDSQLLDPFCFEPSSTSPQSCDSWGRPTAMWQALIKSMTEPYAD